MKIIFIPKRFSSSSLELIRVCNTVLEEYKSQRYKLTLRQLYYQLVSRDFIPNTIESYKRVGGLVSDARNAGVMEWEMIEDRGREAVLPSSWENPAEIIRTAARAFRLDRWRGQEEYVEVMCEKDALTGIIQPVCNDLHVRFTANRGYSSSSAMFDAGRRIRDALSKQEIGTANHATIFYFGDHDPSGLDMTRDVKERLYLYSGFDPNETAIDVKRLALNMDQVRRWNPPKNPAKETDSRFKSYKDEFGDSSWELDAIEPKRLAKLIRENIEGLIDPDVWNAVIERENAMRKRLEEFATNQEEWDAK